MYIYIYIEIELAYIEGFWRIYIKLDERSLIDTKNKVNRQINGKKKTRKINVVVKIDERSVE